MQISKQFEYNKIIVVNIVVLPEGHAQIARRRKN